MADSSKRPPWRVTEWDGSSQGPITFGVQSPKGTLFIAQSADGLAFTHLYPKMPDATKYQRAKVEATITAYTFKRAFLARHA